MISFSTGKLRKSTSCFEPIRSFCFFSTAQNEKSLWKKIVKQIGENYLMNSLLVNKFDNLPFTKNDENFVEAFAIFCGMGIHNVHMYEKTVLAMAKQQVTLEVLR
jgi:hypothetical protein